MSLKGLHPGALSPDAWANFMPTPAQVASTGEQWGPLALRRHRHPPSGRVQPPPLAAHFIVIHLDTPCELGVQLNGQWLRGHTCPGQISIMSANQENLWEWNAAIDSLHVSLDPRLLQKAAHESALDAFELVDGIGLDSKPIYDIGLKLLDELTDVKIGSQRYVEALTQTLCLELLRAHCVFHPDEPGERITLSPRRLKAALEFIENNLERNLSVEDIAQAAHSGAFHFAHTFRQAMGVSPYHYLLQRRIERAKTLLRETDTKIIDVAIATGFSSQSHFASCFRKYCNETPRRFRKLASP